MFISTQEIFGLIKNSLRDLINILTVSMLALGLPSSPLLAKTDTFSRLIDDILLNGFFTASSHSILSEVILRVFSKKVLTSNFPDGRIEICSFIQFLKTTLICWSLCSSRGLMLRIRVYGIVFIENFMGGLDIQGFDFWELNSRSSVSRTVS